MMNEQEPKKRGRPAGGMTSAQVDNARFDVDQRIKFDRSKDRVRGGDVELNMSIPPGTIPEGFVGYWALDDGKGSIDKMQAQWWGFVTDAQGVNITRPSGYNGQLHYLMAIEQKYYDENNKLREEEYRASIGEKSDASMSGIETYNPNGDNKVKINRSEVDPFS